MTDNELIQLFVPIITAGLSSNGFPDVIGNHLAVLVGNLHAGRADEDGGVAHRPLCASVFFAQQPLQGFYRPPHHRIAGFH